MKPPIPYFPVIITRCPTAYAAPSTGQISAAHAHAIREHNHAIEKARAAKGKTPPIVYGKRAKKRPPIFHRTSETAFFDPAPDILDDLPGGFSLNG